ncbi:hypothetical protein ASE74_15270 [Pedobacter sp. Leaf216]|uniref:hypothetical protein n=1 Tax=Pedobacter sp. Leaf216 TaxID=1735684 RepID=UPI0006FB7347|nr:hypothetical protein [Pedobacter sp. Leaf216]KQM78069.1 hypothetical protein ASE74_15270 [Pedobacter sp. Leaf216]
MKLKLIPTIIMLLIFALLTAISYQDNAASDGFTKIGFPFNFYLYSGGKFSNPSITSDFGFSTKYFIADLFILILVIVIGNIVVNKWRETNK